MTAPGAGAMRDEDWRSLTSAIENGTCILMLGPDAFVADFDGETLPVAVGMARAGCSTRSSRTGSAPSDADVDPSNPWTVAQLAVDEGGRLHAALVGEGLLRHARHGVGGAAHRWPRCRSSS